MSPVCVSPSSSALARPKSVIQTTPVGVQQQVRRLDVAVDDAAGVGVGQPLRRLAADLRHAAEERLPAARGLDRRDAASRRAGSPSSTTIGGGRVGGRCRSGSRAAAARRSRPASNRSVPAESGCVAGAAPPMATSSPFGRRAGRSGAIRPPGRARASADRPLRRRSGLDADRGRSPARSEPGRGRARSGLPIGPVAEPPQLGDDLVEPLALDELHGVEADVAVLADLEDRHDVGVVQPRRGLRLAAEPLQGHRGRPTTWPRQDLQRHAAAQRDLLGLVDDPHAAPADLAEDPVVADLPEARDGGRRRPDRLVAGVALGLLDLDQGREQLADLVGQLRVGGRRTPASSAARRGGYRSANSSASSSNRP